MAFLIQTEFPEWSTATLRYEPCTQFINVSQRALHIYWQFSAMSHAIHKIVSKRRCQSYFIARRSPHHGISKDSDLCASAHRCPHYAYARLIARVNSQFVSVVHGSLQKSPEVIQTTYQVPQVSEPLQGNRCFFLTRIRFHRRAQQH